jgi:hypothetical protein
MGGHAVGDVDDADARLDEHLQAAVEHGQEDPPGAAGAPGALDRGGVQAQDLEAGLGGDGEHGALAVDLRLLVGRQVRAAVRRVLAAHGALRLAERRRRRGVDEARDARPRGGPRRRPRAVDVDPPQRRRVGRAEPVDAGHVVGDAAARHPGGQRRLVEHVAAGRARARGGQLPRALIRAGQRHHLVAALDQPAHERAPHEPGSPGDVDPVGHRA